MSNQEYVLGTHDAELVRLGFQHRVWARHAFSAWLRAGIAPGRRVLDVGCGPGYATFDLAGLVAPGGTVFGVDESQRFLDFLQLQQRARGVTNVTSQLADVRALTVPSGSFDAAYARWVLCFVSEPQRVVEGVGRALRAGGRFIIQDYVQYDAIQLAPRGENMARVGAAVSESVRRRGGDPNVGARLPELLIGAGFSVRSIRPIVRVARPGSALWKWPETFFANYLPVLEQSGLISPDDRRGFEVDWEESSRDPAAFFVTPPMCEVIAVRK